MIVRVDPGEVETCFVLKHRFNFLPYTTYNLSAPEEDDFHLISFNFGLTPFLLSSSIFIHSVDRACHLFFSVSKTEDKILSDTVVS